MHFMYSLFVVVGLSALFSTTPTTTPSPHAATITHTAQQPPLQRMPGVFVLDSTGQPVALSISKLNVHVTIVGTIATTTLDMTVFNPHNRVLEGEFSFPIADGQVVSGFALDINGKLRDAVVVDKTKGRSTFEEVIRTKVDPALMEWTRDNAFRTRIYPIPARGTRRIVISYEQPLDSQADGFSYTLPLAYQQPIPECSLTADVAGFGVTPSLTGAGSDTITFSPKNRAYHVQINKKNILLNHPLHISVPVALDHHRVVVQEHKGSDYVGVFLNSEPDRRPRIQPRTVTVLWDASISGMHRNVEKEIAFLQHFLSVATPARIDLTVFAHSILHKESYTSPEPLINRIRTLPMDGGTQLGIVPLSGLQTDMAILFSDGISTFGKHRPTIGNTPICTITSGGAADFAVLQDIARKSGGQFINISTKETEDAVLDILTERKSVRSVRVVRGRIAAMKPDGIVPLELITVFSGKLLSKEAELEFEVGYNSGELTKHTITVSSVEHRQAGRSIPRLWATQEVNRLRTDSDQNDSLITEIGQHFDIVTPGTSLIVLENIEDYVRFNIEPPATEPELRRMFLQRKRTEQTHLLMQKQRQKMKVLEILKNPKGVGGNIIQNKGQQFWMWPSTSTAPLEFPTEQLGSIEGVVLQGENMPLSNTTVTITNTPLSTTTDVNGVFQFAEVPAGNHTLQVLHSSDRPVTSTATVQPSSTTNATILLPRRTAQIKEYSIEQPGLSLGNGATTVQTRVGRNNLHLDTVYSEDMQDAADRGYMFRQDVRMVPRSNSSYPIQLYRSGADDSELAPEPSTIIENSNPGWFGNDTEVWSAMIEEQHRADSTHREMWAQALEKTTASSLYADYLRLRESYGNQTGFYLDIADKFIEYGLNDQALRVLSSLSELQGEDARTLRILAHRLLQIGHVDLAIHVFKDVLSVRNEEPQSYRDLGLALAAAGRYSEAIQHLLYVLEHPWHNRFPEIERIVARELSRIAALPAVKGISIPKEYLIPFQNDVRVVLTWDADNCDMDLWVTDPDGELCMYSNRFTKIGGCLSRDLTGGYGPEEFVLPTAKKGAYKVEVHYYGSRQQTVTRPTTVQVDMFTKYGSTSEKHHAVTMRLDGVSRLLDIGTILVE